MYSNNFFYYKKASFKVNRSYLFFIKNQRLPTSIRLFASLTEMGGYYTLVTIHFDV